MIADPSKAKPHRQLTLAVPPATREIHTHEATGSTAPDPTRTNTKKACQGREDGHLSSNDGDGRQRIPERREGALLSVVSESRACPLQLVDEGDQVIHGRSAGWARSERVEQRGGGGERSRRGAGRREARRGDEVRPTAQPRLGVGRWARAVAWWRCAGKRCCLEA